MSISSPHYFFNLSLPLLKPFIANLSHLRTWTSVHLLFTCPNYQISSFIISSLLVCPRIHRKILISTTSIF
uniref:Putative ovule protein n=1 Tax=Solanum chacoense TaxID=4108 RepID=A0A0V0GPE6_SOLCH